MKWTFSIKNKVAASGALLSLCLLVLFSNYIDRDHTNNVRSSITTLYEDRLVAETYILTMTSNLYQVKEILKAANPDQYDQNGRMTNLLTNILETNKAYLTTKLTPKEEKKSAELVKILNEFKTKGAAIELENADAALVLLNELSAIQLEESKLIMNKAEILFFSSKVSTQFAFALTVIILLVLQAIVFTSKTVFSKSQLSATNLN